MSGVFSVIFPIIMAVSVLGMDAPIEDSTWKPLVEKQDARDVSMSRVMAFNILRNGKRIGTHIIKLSPLEDGFAVSVDLRLKVSFGPLTVYRFSHDSREEWRDGRLLKMNSKTNENGDKYSVLVGKSPAGLMARGQSGSVLLPKNILTTTYWNRETVKVTQMLDTQTGKLISYQVEGPFFDEGLQAERYILTGDLNLELWYQGEEFIKMAFDNQGAKVEYELMSGREAK